MERGQSKMNFNKILNKSKEVGFSDFEIHIQTAGSLEASLFLGEIQQNVQSDITSITLRGVYNEKLVLMKIERLDEDYIISCLPELKEMANYITTKEPVFLFEGSKSYPEIPEHIENIDDFEMDKKIELLKKLEETIVSYDNRIAKEVNCAYQESIEGLTIVNTKGLNVSRNSKGAFIYAQALAKTKTEAQSSFDFQMVTDFNEFDVVKLGKKIANDAVSMLGAQPLPSKKYDVVFDESAFSSLLGAFSGMFSADAAMKKLSPIKDKLNEKIFGDNVTIVDTGINKDALSFVTFDSEGVSTRYKEVVKNGVFKTFLHNLQTASVFNAEPTGNGTKNGVSTLCFYLEKGNDKFEDIIKDITDGVYVTDLMGLHAGLNTQSGDFNLQSSGYHIVNGEIKEPFNLVVISGNFMEMMNEITHIGDKVKYRFGTGSPVIRVKPLMVSGK